MIKILERNLKKFLADKTGCLPEDIGFNLSPFPEISWSNPSERNIRLNYGDLKIHLSYERMNDSEDIFIILDLFHIDKESYDKLCHFNVKTKCKCLYKDAYGSIGYDNNGILRLQNGFKLEAVIISILSAINTDELHVIEVPTEI